MENGGPTPEKITEQIYQESLRITKYHLIDHDDIDLDVAGCTQIGDSEIEIIDPLDDYTAVMASIFDFDALRALFQRGWRMTFDAMHAVTGPYAHHILEELLGAPPGTVVNAIPREDFGGHHPDPNLVNAVELVTRMRTTDAPDFGAACDGDGDRNLILGRDCFVTPGDSLAIIAEHSKEIPGYRRGLAGVARSMPTSTAIDRVAAARGIPCYETPTGWKFFGNLMDADRCTICGEESFGTGSNHVREKDGLWAVLCWLAILATKQQSVQQVVREHWQRFGRSYYQRHDYENLDATRAGEMIADLRDRLPSLEGQTLPAARINQADDFSYTDPIDGSVTERQGIRVQFADGSRIVCRLSGTGTEGATMRLYVERYLRDGGTGSIDEVLAPLVQSAESLLRMKERLGREAPTLIT